MTQHSLCGRLSRRNLLQTLSIAAAASCVPAAHAAQKRVWPDMPEIPTDFNAERCFVELEEKGEGVTFPGPEGAPFVCFVFDPQCQWCVWQFEQLKPWLGRVTFVWHPVAVLNPWSEPQGAAILAAKDPKATFLEHESHYHDEKFKGLDVRGMEIPFEKRTKVWDNSKTFRRAGGASVPFGVLRTADGRYVPVPQSTAEQFERITGVARK